MEQLPVPPSSALRRDVRSGGRAGVTFGGRDEIGRGVTRRRHLHHRKRGPKRGTEMAATTSHEVIVAAFLPPMAEI